MIRNKLASSAATTPLQESDIQFRQLVAGVADYAIYMLDATGHIVTWNTGAERIKGYSAEEIIGQHFSRFYTPEDRLTGVPDRALATAAREGKYEADGWRMRKDGTRFWAAVLIDAIHDDDGRLIGFAKVTRDMTERREMEEQLHQSQKMEAIGQLTGGVAHDFNNLLTVIIGNLETISKRLPEEDQRLQRAAEHAMLGARRAATLTQQLLAFARRQPLHPRIIDINQLVAGMTDLLRRTLGETITVETVLANGLWMTEVDPHQLESALLNLAVNARDAMPEGGDLRIRTANIEQQSPELGPRTGIPVQEYVAIYVTDTGCGMSEDVLMRAFEPFFTTKPLGQGTGLGLSQVYGFVKQSGGHIRLDSEFGRGTTVTLFLPRQKTGQPVGPQSARGAEVQASGNETILVVEDEGIVRMFSADCLRELGYTVLEAQDGVSALSMLQQHPEIQLLFTDVGLPGMNGRQLAEQATRQRPKLKVLFTSGYAQETMVHQGRLDPGVELLIKPFSHAQLGKRIRMILDRRG